MRLSKADRTFLSLDDGERKVSDSQVEVFTDLPRGKSRERRSMLSGTLKNRDLTLFVLRDRFALCQFCLDEVEIVSW